MWTITARLPDDLESELETYLEAEGIDRSTAIQQLLADGLEAWRQEQALGQLAGGEISVTRAAEIADMSTWDFARLAKDNNVIWVSKDHCADDIESL